MLPYETHCIFQRHHTYLRILCCFKILNFFLDVAKTELSPKMTDFIAYRMSEEDCDEICREYLRGESEHRIKKDNLNNVYDQSYAIIRLLIDKLIISNIFDMENVLNKVNNDILNKFRQKLRDGTLVPG